MARKNILLLCNGLSGSGKTYFIENFLGRDAAYNLKSMTTRQMRDGESWGEKYYFVDADVFDQVPTATTLFVNRAFWTPGKPKWLYGVPEFEIYNHLGGHLVYDVIQPRYSRHLIDWFNLRGLDKYYDYRVLWFLAPENNMEIAGKRANMPDDGLVRTKNTCDAIDFLRADLRPDYLLKSSESETIIPGDLTKLCDYMKQGEITHRAVPKRYPVQKHILETLAEKAQNPEKISAEMIRTLLVRDR